MNPDLAKVRDRLARLLTILDHAPHLLDSACVVVITRRPDAGPGNLDCSVDLAIHGSPAVLGGILEEVSDTLLGEGDVDDDEEETSVRPN